MSLKDSINKIREKLKWLDPFTYVDLWVMPRINPNKNEYIETITYMVFAFVFAFAFYSLLGLCLSTPNPLVIVLSGSMEPVFHRGDILILQGVSGENIIAEQTELDFDLSKKTMKEFATPNYSSKTISFANNQTIPLTTEGDVVVYYSDINPIQIVHRVAAKIKTPQGFYYLTKGDAPTNPTIDQDCGFIYVEQFANQKLFSRWKEYYQINNQYCYCASSPKNSQDLVSECFFCSEKPCARIYPIHESTVDGRVAFIIPFVGNFKLWVFDDFPFLLPLLIAAYLGYYYWKKFRH